MTNARKPQLEADFAYENAHTVAKELVERINELLFDMPAPYEDDHKINWSHVGSINEVNKRLSDIVAFLDGNTEE
jgi:hypothetical protein